MAIAISPSFICVNWNSESAWPNMRRWRERPVASSSARRAKPRAAAPTVERLYREIRALRIYEGASEVLKLIIGGKVLEAAAAVDLE